MYIDWFTLTVQLREGNYAEYCSQYGLVILQQACEFV